MTHKPFHLSAPFYSKGLEQSLLSISASTPSLPALPHSPPVVLPLCHSTKLLFSRSPETSVFPNPAVTLMQLTASSDRKHFISELPGFSLSWLCSQAFLPSHPNCLQTSKAPGLAGLSALSCLHSLLSPGLCSFKSSHAPSLSSPSSLLSTSCVYPQAYLSSPLAHLRDLSKTELLIFIPKITSPSSLDSSLPHPTPKPSTHQVSTTPETHPKPTCFPCSSALALISPCLDNCSSLLPLWAP